MIYLLTISPTGGGEGDFNPNQTRGGGPNGPPGFKSLISQEPKVGLTSNQAVNLSPLSRDLCKKIGQFGP